MNTNTRPLTSEDFRKAIEIMVRMNRHNAIARINKEAANSAKVGA